MIIPLSGTLPIKCNGGLEEWYDNRRRAAVPSMAIAPPWKLMSTNTIR